MASNGVASKYSVQHLQFMKPPLPASGGRIMTPAGEMAQIISNETIRHVVYLEFNPDGKPRGNHYHVKMQSHGVYVIAGHIKVALIDLDDKSRTTVDLRGGDFIRIKPNCAHAFVAQEYSQAIELNNTPLDLEDTIPYKIDGAVTTKE